MTTIAMRVDDFVRAPGGYEQVLLQNASNDQITKVLLNLFKSPDLCGITLNGCDLSKLKPAPTIHRAKPMAPRGENPRPETLKWETVRLLVDKLMGTDIKRLSIQGCEFERFALSHLAKSLPKMKLETLTITSPSLMRQDVEAFADQLRKGHPQNLFLASGDEEWDREIDSILAAEGPRKPRAPRISASQGLPAVRGGRGRAG